jgi:cation:H+ antiporter
VLAVLDGFGVRTAPLMYRAASLVLLLEGALVVALLVIVIMGTRLASSVIYARVTPPGIAVVVFWIGGLWLIGRARRGLPWHEDGNPPDGQAGPRGISQAKKDEQHSQDSTVRAAAVFGIAALVTLAAGVVLERSGEKIAGHIGLSGVLFGATVLAAATSLPEVSTGLASLRLGDYQLAVSDIFGGNAFLPVLFLVATLISGDAVLPNAKSSDVYLTALGVLLTVIYMSSIVFRPKRQFGRLGPDSILVLVIYAVAIAALPAVAPR